MTKSITLMLVLPLLLLLAGSQAQAESIEAGVDAFVRERMAALDIPGAALAVVRGEEIVHLAGYGIANPAGKPVTPQTPFLLASISKSMTSVAVMQLVEDGRVELDAPIQRYLPWFMPESPITVRQLLVQTSGLDGREGYIRSLEPDAPDALANSIRRLAGSDLNQQPGKGYEYSNSNADVLGLLVEEVSGVPFEAYLQAQLFDPLQMTHTFTSLKAGRAAGMSSAFYPFFGRQTAFDSRLPYTRAILPSAGVIGSVEDVARYLSAHLHDGRYSGAQILSPEGMATLHTPDALITPGFFYSMGWMVWELPEAAAPGEPPPRVLSHGGQWLGANHLALFIPERELAVVWLTNSRDTTLTSATSQVAVDVALLALDRPPRGLPPQEDFQTRHARLLTAGLLLLLLVAAAVALWRLRRPRFGRLDLLLFGGLLLFDAALVGYLLLWRLPRRETSVAHTLAFEPDIGLMLVGILALAIGWGSARTLLALARWRRLRKI